MAGLQHKKDQSRWVTLELGAKKNSVEDNLTKCNASKEGTNHGSCQLLYKRSHDSTCFVPIFMTLMTEFLNTLKIPCGKGLSIYDITSVGRGEGHSKSDQMFWGRGGGSTIQMIFCEQAKSFDNIVKVFFVHFLREILGTFSNQKWATSQQRYHSRGEGKYSVKK